MQYIVIYSINLKNHIKKFFSYINQLFPQAPDTNSINIIVGLYILYSLFLLYIFVLYCFYVYKSIISTGTWHKFNIRYYRPIYSVFLIFLLHCFLLYKKSFTCISTGTWHKFNIRYSRPIYCIFFIFLLHCLFFLHVNLLFFHTLLQYFRLKQIWSFEKIYHMKTPQEVY